MTFDWKQALGSIALYAMALSMIGTGGAVAQSKPDPVKPTPPSAEKIETGQMLDKGPRWKPIPSAREAAPPATGDGATPPSAEKIETGQKLDKPRWPYGKATERRAHSGPGGTPSSTAKKGSNTGLILGITAGAAALAAVLASGNNNDNPTSP